MREILFATTNKGKLEEARKIALQYEITLISPEDLQGRGSPPEVEETGDSYEENALLKVKAFWEWSGGKASIADDAGLEVDFLNNEPGIRSARYAEGEKISNIQKLLTTLGDADNRKAEFVSCLAYFDSNKVPIFVTQRLKGSIAKTPSGNGGFGYDPIFEVDGYNGETLASLKERGVLVETHRIMAFRSLFKLVG